MITKTLVKSTLADRVVISRGRFPQVMFYDWRDVEKAQVLNLLKQVRELFLDQANWVGWPIAIDRFDKEVSPHSIEARRFSLMGACEKFSALVHSAPLCDFVSCATKDYLDDLSNNKLFKEELSYTDEFALISLAIEELEREEVNANNP